MHKSKNEDKRKQEGQSIIEYTILFSVVIGVIILAATTFIKPSLEGLYERTSGVINDINPTLINSN